MEILGYNLIRSAHPSKSKCGGVCICLHPSLHPNCHHQIVYAKFELGIYFAPPYSRDVCHYKDLKTEHTKREIQKFHWQRSFLNTIVNEKVVIFNSTVLNILSNFIPQETIVCDDKDPPWLNS